MTTTSLRFLGGARTVTGSKTLLEVGERKILVDCGLFQGLKPLRLKNRQALPVDPASIDHVVLTHAHIDHSGYLPKLVKDGFVGRIWATRATAALAPILLRDSGHLQEEEADFHNKIGSSKHSPALPLYTAEEGLRAARKVEGFGYGERLDITPEVSATFRPAGHILGSATVTFEIGVPGRKPRRLVFSGDLGRGNDVLLPDPSPLGLADAVVVESTYGDRLHDPGPVSDRLRDAVLAGIERGGVILIPAFAVDRTQIVLYYLAGLERRGEIPRLDVWLDSPMAIDATEIYCRHAEEFEPSRRREILNRINPLRLSQLHLARTPDESRALNEKTGPFLLLSASGMATGGRVLHHLKLRLPEARNTVLLTGHQAEGTRGARLERGEKTVKIFGEEVPVRAHVENIHGLSAHADRDELMAWLRTAEKRPERLFVNHGEERSATALAELAEKELGWPATVPKYGERIVLWE